jgi:hypothetical protein
MRACAWGSMFGLEIGGATGGGGGVEPRRGRRGSRKTVIRLAPKNHRSLGRWVPWLGRRWAVEAVEAEAVRSDGDSTGVVSGGWPGEVVGSHRA